MGIREIIREMVREELYELRDPWWVDGPEDPPDEKVQRITDRHAELSRSAKAGDKYAKKALRHMERNLPNDVDEMLNKLRETTIYKNKFGK
jgi:hypothetical protein